MIKKKPVISLICLIVFIVILSLSICYKYIDIALVNHQIDVEGFRLLDKEENLKEIIDQQFTQIEMWGGRNFFNEKQGIEIVFSGFPDVIDQGVLTVIITTNPKHAVFNIHVGDDIEKAQGSFIKKGFKLQKYNGNYGFSRNKVSVLLHHDGSTVSKIVINLKSTNKQKVVF